VQALKLIRYTARLAAAISPESELKQRCSAFEKSVGVSRWLKEHKVGEQRGMLTLLLKNKISTHCCHMAVLI